MSRYILTAGAAVLFTALLILFLLHGNGAEVVIASVNSEPIEVREFEFQMDKKRGEVYQYFAKEYSAEDSAGFWKTSYGGEVPLTVLKEKALEECVKIKVQQILAKSLKVTEDIRYSSFLKALDKENERREKTLKKGGIIYGPVKYDEVNFFEYTFSNMVIQLKNRLGEMEFNAPKSQLEAYYQVIKPDFYVLRGKFTVERLTVPYRDDKGNFDEDMREDATVKIKECMVKADKGQQLEDIAKEYSDSTGSPFYKKITVDTENEKYIALDEPIFYKEAKIIPEGQVSEIINTESAYMIVKCVEREEPSYKAFNEVEENVKLRYIDEKYTELIEKLVLEADVHVDEPVLEKLE